VAVILGAALLLLAGMVESETLAWTLIILVSLGAGGFIVAAARRYSRYLHGWRADHRLRAGHLDLTKDFDWFQHSGWRLPVHVGVHVVAYAVVGIVARAHLSWKALLPVVVLFVAWFVVSSVLFQRGRSVS
jgi:hypothetical protein